MRSKLLLLFMLPMLIGAKLLAAPVITSFSPASGPVGALVTINGTDLNNPTAFTIGGVTAVVVSNTGTRLVGLVMPGAKTGEAIKLSVASGSTESQNTFTVTPVSAPVVPEQGPKIEGSVAVGVLGTNMALSTDGNTAVITGSLAVGVYVRNGNTWSQQAVLHPSDNSGAASFGSSLALSADGNTAIIGGNTDNKVVGAAWIFVRTGTIWQQQGAKLVGIQPGLREGTSVSISADGNTAVVGAPGITGGDKGGAFIFKRLAGAWQQWGTELIGIDESFQAPGQQGYSVALSADGKTLASGGLNTNGFWIFVPNGDSWQQQGEKIQVAYGGSSGLGGQGSSLAITADGTEVLTAGYYRDLGVLDNVGTWIYSATAADFKLINGIWISSQYSQIFGEMAGENPGPVLVSINADGQLAMIKGPSSDGPRVALFDASHKKIAEPTPSGQYVDASGLSADGYTALIAKTREGNFGTVSPFVSAERLPHQITFNPGPVYYGAADTLLLATSTEARLPIKFISSSDTTVATIINNKVHVKKAGTTNITAMQNDADITPVAAQLIVKKAPLTITADNKKKVVGTENPVFTATYTGFKNGDDTTAVTVKPIFSTVATSASAVGNYPINVSGAAASNYEFIYLAGTLTVLQQPQGIPKITSFSPASGQAGALVTVTGSNIEHPSVFTIGGKPALIISSTPEKLVGMVMPGAASGPVFLSTDSGSVTAGNFDVVRLSAPSRKLGDKVFGSGAIGRAGQGHSIAVSADGNTAITGGVGDNEGLGAAWVFVRNGDAWQQQGDKLVGTGNIGGSLQGMAVAISADGNTAISLGSQDNFSSNSTKPIGAVWVFVRNGNTWQQQGNKLVSFDTQGLPTRMRYIGISADGNTIAIGGRIENKFCTWVYSREGTEWKPTIKLLGDQDGGEGYMSISADGKTIIQQSGGAFLIFTKNSNTWNPKPEIFAGGGIPCLSADGKSFVVQTIFQQYNDPRSEIPYYYQNIYTTYNKTAGGWIKSTQNSTELNGYISGGNNLIVNADAKIFIGSGASFTETGFENGIYVFSNRNENTNGGSVYNLDLESTQPAGATISADGTVAVVGDNYDGSYRGAIRFYVSNGKLIDKITFNPVTVSYGAPDTLVRASSTNTQLPIKFSNSNDTTVAVIINNSVHIKGVGTTKITAIQDDASIVPVTATLTVKQAGLTITADNKTKQPGTDNPVFTATYSGFKNGDDNTTAFATQPVFTTTATKNSPLGTYPITVGGASAKNYSFVYVSGTLTVASNALPNNVNVKLTISPLAVLTLASSNSGQYDYTASVAAGTNSVIVTPVPANPGATVTVEGVTVASGAASAPIVLNSGVTVIHVVVHAADGTTVRDYNISVSKTGSSDASLKSLSLINPRAALVSVSSDGTTLNKSASVPASTGTVSVYAVANDSTATIRVNGAILNGTTSGPVTLNAGNMPTQIDMSVTAKDGTSRAYIITVNKTGSSDASLKSLRITDPESVLVNGTSSGNVFYRSTSVASTTTVVTLSAEATEAHATIRVNGTLLTGTSMPITLNSDNNPTNINVLVTAHDGTTATYIVVVSKNGSSNTGLLSWGIFGPTTPVTSVSSSGTTFYKAATVANSVQSIFIKVLPADRYAIIRVNGKIVTKGQSETIYLNGDNTPTTILMVVTAQDGSTRVYVIVVSKAPALEGNSIKEQQSFASAPVSTEVVVHQGVSPNGDGLNDVLVIDGLEDKKDNHLSIIDINGTLIYETQAYGGNGNVFNGHSNKTGVLQKPGTYYYVLDYNDGKAAQRKTGYIVLKY